MASPKIQVFNSHHSRRHRHRSKCNATSKRPPLNPCCSVTYLHRCQTTASRKRPIPNPHYTCRNVNRNKSYTTFKRGLPNARNGIPAQDRGYHHLWSHVRNANHLSTAIRHPIRPRNAIDYLNIRSHTFHYVIYRSANSPQQIVPNPTDLQRQWFACTGALRVADHFFSLTYSLISTPLNGYHSAESNNSHDTPHYAACDWQERHPLTNSHSNTCKDAGRYCTYRCPC